MNCSRPASRLHARLRAAFMAFGATCLALPVHAATSFPDYPLQTGVASVPPNILLILDDSGSMAWDFMPGATANDASPLNNKTSPARIGLKTYVHNTLYYDPSIAYQPWLKADRTRYTGGTSMAAVYASDTRAGDGQGTTDIRGGADYSEANANGVNEYYVPKTGVTDYTNSNNFDRYMIVRINGEMRVLKGQSQQLSENDEDIDEGEFVNYPITVPSGALLLQAQTSGGTGNVGLSIRLGTVTACTSASSGGNDESCSVANPAAGQYMIRLTASSGPGNQDVNNVDLVVNVISGTFETPTGRTEAAEIANYATWYSYHRTRTKVAKAGASEAFAGLGENFRVGYDSIWNRGGQSGDGIPAYPIPVSSDGGLFRSSNKTAWFNYLHQATASDGTPLRSALRRAGRYYQRTGSDGPWASESGPQLSCRQSYAILTTDGYWNSDSNFSAVGNADNTQGSQYTSADQSKTLRYNAENPYKDSYSNTLADVANYYWKTDLHTTLANAVPTTGQDPAFWQHMTTFGISIGLQGTLGPNDVPQIGISKQWPDPHHNGEEGPWRIDDLLHAAVNGHGSFVAATNPQAFANALRDALTSIQTRKASGSNVASNGPSLSTDSLLFQAVYTSGEWSGDVHAYSLIGGRPSTDPVWKMSAVANADNPAFRARPVLTWSGQGGARFPTNAQVSALNRSQTGETAPVSGELNAEYLMGSRIEEATLSPRLGLRKRASPFGDIVNSSPYYVRESNALFIGANDGMMHAVNGANGRVLFSYVPMGQDFSKLKNLSKPDYQHAFFVDGGIDVTSYAQGKNKNILVGSLGRGGRGLYALDVTNPSAFTAANVLWDKTFSSNASSGYDADMGHVLGAPLVRQGNNGKTLVMSGNGIDSDNYDAVLYIHVLNDDGSVSQTVKHTVAYGTAAAPNGLADVRAADINSDGKADYLYAGDLQGNLWKFDIRSTSTAAWGVANGGSPLFVATNAAGVRQPITAAVAIAREPDTARMFVAFGTGRYISDSDIRNTAPQTQTVYSLIDGGLNGTTYTIAGRNELQERTIPYTGRDALGRMARAWEAYSALPSGKKGWYVDLGVPSDYALGERVVTAPVIRTEAMWFSSIIPKAGSGCESGGTGFLNAVNVFTGTNPKNGSGDTYGFIDVDRDGIADDKLQNDALGTGEGYVTSVDVGVGMPTQPTVLGNGNSTLACISGTDAELDCVPGPPPSGASKRLSWRELYDRD